MSDRTNDAKADDIVARLLERTFAISDAQGVFRVDPLCQSAAAEIIAWRQRFEAAQSSAAEYLDAYDEAAAEIAELRRRATGMEKALRSAHHALTLLHGCVATDRADQVPGMDTDKYKNLVWTVNNHKELTEIEAALTGAKP